MEEGLKKKTDERMKGAIEALKKDFGSIRTGRASMALLDGITVNYYGTPSGLAQVATLNIPEGRQITIQPWDQKLIQEIERAIMKSDLGLTPINDGKVIRINIPLLTEERRRELVKLIRKRGEENRVVMRNIRRDSNEALRKFEKEKEISEDELKKSLDEVQKMTDAYIKKVDETVEHKEREIMEV